MQFRLRTLLIVITTAGLLLGWDAHLRRMTVYHDQQADLAWSAKPDFNRLLGAEGVDRFYSEQNRLARYHYKRARNYQHGLIRPWLLVVDCEPGSFWGQPLYLQEVPGLGSSGPVPIAPRLKPRDD